MATPQDPNNVPPTTESHSSIPPAALNALNAVKNQANFYLTRLDKELAKHECANEIERKSGLPKSYVVLGASALFFFLVFFNLGAQLLTNVLAFVYPAYASFKAIETPNKEDDTQWLTYWVVVAFAQIIEYFSDILLYWFPFYYTFKTLVILWLLLPQFRGALIVYERFLRPCLLSAEAKVQQQKSN